MIKRSKGNIGYKHTPETKKKLSELKTGSKHTAETKRKISEARTRYLEKDNCELYRPEWIELPNGIRVQGEWEYNVGLRLIELGYDISRGERLVYDGHRTYTPDFKIGEYEYIEVKGWLSKRDSDKYKKVYESHPDVKIYLIRNECGQKNYNKFINKEIELKDCEDLIEAVTKERIYKCKNPSGIKKYGPRKEKKVHLTREEYSDLKKIRTNEKYKQIAINLLNSGIDFTSFGWVRLTSEFLGIPHQKVNRWMKRHLPEFYEEKCYKRKI